MVPNWAPIASWDHCRHDHAISKIKTSLNHVEPTNQKILFSDQDIPVIFPLPVDKLLKNYLKNHVWPVVFSHHILKFKPCPKSLFFPDFDIDFAGPSPLPKHNFFWSPGPPTKYFVMRLPISDTDQVVCREKIWWTPNFARYPHKIKVC